MKNNIGNLLFACSLSFISIGHALAEQPKTTSATSNRSATSANSVTAPTLIDRKLLFGNPSRFQGRLSPSGELMSFMAPVNGVMNVWVGKRGEFDTMKPVTKDTGRGVPSHSWALDSKHILYTQDKNGDENWHLYSIDLASGSIKNLTPYENISAQLIAQSTNKPGVAIVGINDRDPRWHDVYEVNLTSGERSLLSLGTDFGQIFVDNNLQVRLALKPQQNGDYWVMKRHKNEWVPLFEIPFEDTQTTQILGFDKENKGIYLLDSRNRDTSALVHLQLKNNKLNTLASSHKVDINNVLFDPKTYQPIAYSLNYIRPIWHSLSKPLKPIIAKLNKQLTGGSNILAQTSDNRYWTVYTDESDTSPIYKIFDSQQGSLNDLFVTHPSLSGLTLSKMHGVVIPTRDNYELVSYLTLPIESDKNKDGIPEKPVPMVMLVHGGPWARDEYGFSGMNQWLANRGYAVLQVNFRSSTGFGKQFLNAGNMEWANAMHHDLLDAKKWAVTNGITQQDTVAIMGGSYGGYATLVGLTYTPEAFSCGVDIVGPSNLQTLLESIPPYWESYKQTFYKAIGNPTTDDGIRLLRERSPLFKVDQITKPLLIAQGANDPRVKQAESDQIVEAMKQKKIPVTYVLYPDEGHGFQKPENNLSFFAVAEAFLSSCNGGRNQPQGDDFTNSSIQIPHGIEYIPSIIVQ